MGSLNQKSWGSKQCVEKDIACKKNSAGFMESHILSYIESALMVQKEEEGSQSA